MANEEHLKILKQGVEAWNKWRSTNPDTVPDLISANLKNATLSGAKLRGANLSGADLSEADLTEADLTEAILLGTKISDADLTRVQLGNANLKGANLRHANLSNANLKGADLSHADLFGAILVDASLFRARLFDSNLSWAFLNQTDFHQAHLSGANLTEATLGFLVFADLNLRTVRGMETVKHIAPSTVGIDTIYRSKGKIPAQFLRGAGVPDNFIEYMSSLVGTAFEFYSCFISYSGKDQEFADRLYADLQREGVRCWFAPHHVQAGKKLYEQIDVALRLHEKLLLILSPDSIDSEWVQTEIAKARKREIQEGKKVLFPIRLNISYEQLQEWECFDADRGKDSAREIREYYIPDFTRWKDHDQYQEEFKKLVRDLKK